MSPDELRKRADRYRQMALQATDPRIVEALNELADQYNETAAKLASTTDDSDGSPP